jgi:WD40 repeat protein
VSEPRWTLAIDFGTTSTAAAIAIDGEKPRALQLDEDVNVLPSAVALDENGDLLTGREARSEASVFPERATLVPKLDFVDGETVVLDGRLLPSAVLVARVLGRVCAEAERDRGGQPPDRVVLTHPAMWPPPLLGRFREAAHLAGLPDAELLPEPEAAAWHFARPSDGGLIGVFDLGGGTLDTAVLRPAGDGFSLVGRPGGHPRLGGEDFDEILLDRVGEWASHEDEAAWMRVRSGNDPGSRRTLMQLRSDVTRGKERLSSHESCSIPVPGFAEPCRVTRSEFETLILGRVDAAVDEMGHTITDAEARPEDLTAVYLVGGSCKIPLVAKRLRERLNVRPGHGRDPRTVVALGALASVAASSRPTNADGITGSVLATGRDRPIVAAETVIEPPTQDISLVGTETNGDGHRRGGMLAWATGSTAVVLVGVFALWWWLHGGWGPGAPHPSQTTASPSRTPTKPAPLPPPPANPSLALPDGGTSLGVTSIAFNSDGSTIAAADGNGIAYLWDVADGKPAGPPVADGNFCHLVGLYDPGEPCPDSSSTGINDVAFSDHGDLIATADQNGFIHQWSVASSTFGHPVPPLLQAQDPPTDGGALAVAYDPNGPYLATGDGNGHAYLWLGGQVKPEWVLAEQDPAQQPVTALAFSPDGTLLAVGDMTGTTSIFSLSSDTPEAIPPLTDLRGGRVNALAFSPEGDKLLTVADGDGSVYVYQFQAGHTTVDWQWTVPGGASATAVAFSADGSVLAIGDSKGEVYLWSFANPAKPTLLHPLFRNPGGQGAYTYLALNGVTTLAFDPNSPIGTLAVGDANGKTYLWRMNWLP